MSLTESDPPLRLTEFDRLREGGQIESDNSVSSMAVSINSRIKVKARSRTGHSPPNLRDASARREVVIYYHGFGIAESVIANN
jgi:hypothetical protein